MPNLKVIRVTVTEDYFIEMIDEERTEINGWTIDQVKEDWFKNYPMSSYHATRDGHRIGNSKRFVKFEEVTYNKKG